MSTPTGVTPSGFVGKRLPDIKQAAESRLTQSFGDVDLRPESNFGQMVGIHSELYALLWQLAEDIYQSQYPDSASGVSLDHACSLVGVIRIKATATQSDAIVYGIPGTVLSVGTEASNRITGDVYRLPLQTTITASNAVHAVIEVGAVGEFVYTVTVGALPYSYTGLPGDGAAQIIQGLFDAMAAAPFTRTIANNKLTIATTAPVSFTVTANLSVIEAGSPARFVAIDTGAKLLSIGDLTEIETPVSGWDSVNNLVPGITGRERESDGELRTRREESIQVTATQTADAIFSRLRQVADVRDVSVEVNSGTVTDAQGTPRQHVWCIMEGGTNADIARVIFNAIAGGMGMRGTIEEIIESEMSGKSYSIYFDRPTYVDPLVVIEYARTNGFPVDGEQQIKDALFAYGESLRIGDDLIYSRMFTPINSVGGFSVNSMTVNAAVANIVTAPNEKIRLLQANITLVDVT